MVKLVGGGSVINGAYPVQFLVKKSKTEIRKTQENSTLFFQREIQFKIILHWPHELWTVHIIEKCKSSTTTQTVGNRLAWLWPAIYLLQCWCDVLCWGDVRLFLAQRCFSEETQEEQSDNHHASRLWSLEPGSLILEPGVLRRLIEWGLLLWGGSIYRADSLNIHQRLLK